MSLNITIAGMKPDGSINEQVLKAAKETSAVVLQTSLNGSVQPGFSFETLDALYDQAEDFDALIESACDFLLRDGLMFVALGDLAQNRIAASLAQRVRAAGGHVRVISDGSPALGAALAAGLLDGSAGVCIHTASTFSRMDDTSQVLVINEIGSVFMASEIKLRLMSWYDDEYPVLLVDTRSGKGENILLCQLDGAASYGYYTSVVIAPCAKVRKKRFTFADLLDVMAQLRSRNGCPWDKEQTHKSLKRYLIEEGYEVLDAIDSDDMDALADELGDVLLQVVFHARIAEQQGEFDISDVTTAICRKMIARHPHIFGNVTADTPDIVVSNWEQIKKEERGQQTQTDVLQNVPRSMPALMRSGKVQHKAAHVGFDFTEPAQAVDKLREEIDEVAGAKTPDELAAECGDLLFAAVNVVRLYKVEPETALQKATDKFIARFSMVEKLAAERNIDMHTCGLAALDALWDEVKAAEAAKQN